MNLAEEFYTADRDAVIAGLREMSDFLEANPHLPVDAVTMRLYPRREDATGRDLVDQIAAAIGVTTRDDTHYTVTRQFGPVTYQAVHIPAEVQRDHEARHSYTHVIQVGHDTTSGPGVAA